MREKKPSRTAYKVALNIITLGAEPGMEKILPPGIVEATGKLLVASGAAGATSVRWSRSRRMVAVYKAFDWIIPGQFEAFGYRKAFYERQVRDGIGAGATQVLILGAGYDTMGWRLAPEFAAVNFIEVDQPATARLKARGVEAMGKRDNLHVIPANLAKRKLEAILKAGGIWDQSAPTVIVAEGLLMYLLPGAVRELLCQCAAVTGAGSRLVFTYIRADADGRPDVGRWTRLVLWLLKAAGEPWLWSIRPEELGRFLAETGWTNAPELAGSFKKIGVEFLGVARKRTSRDEHIQCE
jgi:methyltransferase (TIGR00027 family)